MPPEVSLPMPMHAKIESAKVQFEMCTSSVVCSIVYASEPRPLFSEMQSSPVEISQPVIVTCLQESMSMPSPLPPVERIVRFLIVMFSHDVGCTDHMLLYSVEKPSR